MIIEHEENPSWAVSSPPPRTAHRRLDPIGARAVPLHRDAPKPFRASLASYVVFGLLIASLLLSGLTVTG